MPTRSLDFIFFRLFTETVLYASLLIVKRDTALGIQ
jgi:hypothetical protein